MASHPKVVNVIVAGLGGQGVVRATDILAEAAFLAGRDVKKSEIHGMSQRGGSVASDVRFGERVLSPMVPAGEADYLVVFDAGQIEVLRSQLRAGGVLITPDALGGKALPNKRSLNVALLGALSTHLDLPISCWHDAIRAHLPEKLYTVNIEAFALGRDGLKS
jgi:indolepyruvate ferredoxin oxidoreductase, beta subunit